MSERIDKIKSEVKKVNVKKVVKAACIGATAYAGYKLGRYAVMSDVLNILDKCPDEGAMLITIKDKHGLSKDLIISAVKNSIKEVEA